MADTEVSKAFECLMYRTGSNPVSPTCIKYRGMAELEMATVLKTVVPQGTGGSNPSPSAKYIKDYRLIAQLVERRTLTPKVPGSNPGEPVMPMFFSLFFSLLTLLVQGAEGLPITVVPLFTCIKNFCLLLCF